MREVVEEGQQKINDLFTDKEEKIRTIIATNLPSSQVEPFMKELRSEWQDQHNLKQAVDGLLAGEKKAPSPEEMMRSGTPKTTSTPPSTPTPPQSGKTPSMEDIWNKLMEMFKEHMMVEQLAGAFTKGQPLPPELAALVIAHDKAKTTQEKDEIYQQITRLISGTAPEKHAPGAPEKTTIPGKNPFLEVLKIQQLPKQPM